MIGSAKLRTNILVAGLAIAFFCGPTAPAQMGAGDPNVQKAKDILLKGVASGNPDTRSLAVMSASLIGDRSEVLTKLYSMLETDKDVPTRITIISTLGSFNNPAVIPALQKALKDPVPEVDLAAALALNNLKQPDGKAFLMDVVEGKQKTSSSFMSSEKRSLARMTHTPTTTFLGIVANQFALPGLGSGMESAVGLSADPASMASASVIFALAKSKDDPAVWPPIVAAMQDKEWATRAAAVHAVAMHNDPSLIDKFVPLMDDKKDQVSFRAAAGYLRLYIIAHKSQAATGE
jgi:HEAT repeat protein